jgi:hypothetical protein
VLPITVWYTAVNIYICDFVCSHYHARIRLLPVCIIVLTVVFLNVSMHSCELRAESKHSITAATCRERCDKEHVYICSVWGLSLCVCERSMCVADVDAV